MKKLALSALALVACTPLFAQGGYLYSPPGLASTESPRYAYYFLRYANGISQLCDGEIRGTKRTLNEIAFRMDYRSHTTANGPGRTWSNMTISMCDGDLATFASTITANRLSTPTQVFSAAVTLPTVTVGYPLTQPAIWGGLTGKLKFPFKTKYSYSGAKDIISEWGFTGGTLTNQGTWSGSTAKYYYLDAPDNGLTPTGSQSSSYSYIPSTRLNNDTTSTPPRTTCNDSAMTTTTGAYAYGYAYTYGKYYSNQGWANKLVMRSYSYYTGFSMPTVHVFAVGNDAKGVDVSTGCNMLHLKGQFVFMDFFTTLPQQYSTSGYSGYRYTIFPWMKQMASLKLTVQAAWADSKTNGFRLSQAAEITFPNAAPPPLRHGGHAYSATATTLNYRSTSYYYNPALRYGHD